MDESQKKVVEALEKISVGFTQISCAFGNFADGVALFAEAVKEELVEGEEKQEGKE